MHSSSGSIFSSSSMGKPLCLQNRGRVWKSLQEKVCKQQKRQNCFPLNPHRVLKMIAYCRRVTNLDFKNTILINYKVVFRVNYSLLIMLLL